jgi:hypothetical protein
MTAANYITVNNAAYELVGGGAIGPMHGNYWSNAYGFGGYGGYGSSGGNGGHYSNDNSGFIPVYTNNSSGGAYYNQNNGLYYTADGMIISAQQAQNGYANYSLEVSWLFFSGTNANPYQTFIGAEFNNGTTTWFNQQATSDHNGSTSKSGQAGGDESCLTKAWNSDIVRLYIPDVVYVNGAGMLTFLGGGGADGGLALPLRGQDAGKVYLYGTFKGKAGLHGGVGVNIGRSNYLGPVNFFDFDATFAGKSAGIEGDYIFGASMSVSEYDQFGNVLLSIDAGVGPAIGGSVNIGSFTYAIPLFKIW